MDRSIESDAKPSWYDAAPFGYLSCDGAGQVLETNRRLTQWLGREPQDLRGKNVRDIFSMASKVVFETSIVPLLSLQGKVEGASLDLLTHDGGKIPVVLSAETREQAGLSVTDIAFLQADARRNLERELITARADAEAKLDASRREGELREQFVAILGHDLRNPLASISSAMNILDRGELAERYATIVKLTQGSVQRMSQLIDNTLDFARNRLGGGIELDVSTDGDLEAEIEQVIQELSAVNPDHRIELEVGAVKNAQLDIARVGQLLSNLLGNALTYGDPDQPVVVRVDRAVDGDFSLSVSNKGEPITPSAMERLFDPFVRSNNHSDRKGLGLGLYIAHEIATAHGGSLTVQSDTDLTTFTFRVPNS